MLFLAFALLVLEVLFLRELAHFSLGNNLTAIGMYARDVYLPLLIGAVLCLRLMQKEKIVFARFSVSAAVFHFGTLAAVSCLLFFSETCIRLLTPTGFTAIILGLVASTVSSVLPVLFDFSKLFLLARANPRRVVLLLVAVCSLVFYSHILEMNWFWLIHITGKSVFYLLKVCGMPVHLVDMAYAIGIKHPFLNVSINMSCSGLEGIVFFLFAFCLYLAVAEPKISLRRFSALAIGGVAMMFVVNTLRISLFLSVAAYMNSIQLKGGKFFSWAFHENIGWLLYLLAIALFLYFIKLTAPCLVPKR